MTRGMNGVPGAGAMRREELALVKGWAETRATLARWRKEPSVPLRAWAPDSLAVALLLLFATWVVATLTPSDPTRLSIAGVTRAADLGDYGFILFRNGLVLALHALACVAGFIAGSSLPQAAQVYSGRWRRVHDRAGPLAIGFVVGATLFSLATQAYALGGTLAILAGQLATSPGRLLLALTPHAVPELFALFLPLAAWTTASRAGAWHDLLAATIVTVAIAVPILLAAAAVETWVTPELLLELNEASVHPGIEVEAGDRDAGLAE